MITGTLMFEAEVSAKDEQELEAVSKSICSSVKNLSGVHSITEVDSDVDDSEDSE